MKVIELLQEAIENPKGPARILTGSGKTALDNPAYSDRAYYEGDPAQFDFGAQRRHYRALKDALARNGKKFDYIAVATAENGRDTFVATAPGVVWYKYESGSTQAGQNILYVNGVKTKTTDFFYQKPEQQDAMLNADPADIRLKKGDALGYLADLARSSKTPDQILSDIDKNQEQIYYFISNSLLTRPMTISKLKTANRLLSGKSALPQWLTVDSIKQSLQPAIGNRISELFPNSINWVDDSLKDFQAAGLILTYDYLNAELDKKQESLFNFVKDSIVMGYESTLKEFYRILNIIGYENDSIQLPNVVKTITAEQLESQVRPGVANQTGNLTKHIPYWIRYGIPKATIVAAFESQKPNLISHSVIDFVKIASPKFSQNIQNSIKLLDLEWPELSDTNFKTILNKYRDDVIKTILIKYKNSPGFSSNLLDNISAIKSIGIDWPELDVIKKSIEHNT